MATSPSLRPDLEPILKKIPTTAGVYVYKDSKDRVIYVGKAANLRSRVRSYFRKSGDDRFHIGKIRKAVVEIETIEAGTERDALVLEDALIKQYQPRFNIKLRDDKSFLFLRLRKDDTFPFLEIIRRPPNDQNPTYGPYPSAKAARRTASVLHKVFPLRTCSNMKFSHRSRPCLDHQNGRCPAPCVGLISEDAYASIADGADKFLRGDRKSARAFVQQEMDKAADDMRYEDAALFRDQLKALDTTDSEPLVYQFGQNSADAWGTVLDGDKGAVVILRSNEGRVVHTDIYAGIQVASSETLEQLLLQYYRQNRFIPSKILLPQTLERLEDITSILTERRGKSLELKCPQRGDGARLVALAIENAKNALLTRNIRDYEQTAVQIEKILHLPRPPLDIECYDVSVHQGADPVGVRVVYSLGTENTDARRRYRLTAGEGQGDPQWMWEMLERRLRRGIEENSMPDLIVLDGGIAQLSAITKLYESLEIEWRRVPLVALAKAREDDGLEHRVDRTSERIYIPGRRNPIVLKPGTDIFNFMVSLRDATHNAVIGYHRNRSRSRLITGLERIQGLGPARRRVLLETYPDPTALVHTPVEEIRKATGLPVKVIKTLQSELSQLQ